MSRVSSQTCFLLQICPNPQRCLGPPLSFLGISGLLRWISFMKKGPSWMVSFSPLFPWGNTPDQSKLALMPHSGGLGRVLPLMKHKQSSSRWCTWTDFVQNEYKQSHCTPLSEVGQLGACWMLDAYTLSLSEITLVSFNFWSQVIGNFPIPASWWYGAGFGWMEF